MLHWCPRLTWLTATCSRFSRAAFRFIETHIYTWVLLTGAVSEIELCILWNTLHTLDMYYDDILDWNSYKDVTALHTCWLVYNAPWLNVKFCFVFPTHICLPLNMHFDICTMHARANYISRIGQNSIVLLLFLNRALIYSVNFVLDTSIWYFSTRYI